MSILLFEQFVKTEYGKVDIKNAQNKVKEPAPNPFTPDKTFELLYILTKASDEAKNVTPIKEVAKTRTFMFKSNQPNDNMTKDYTFKVVMTDLKDKITVERMGEEKALITPITVENENDIEVIVDNYIEATNIYYDGVIDTITNTNLDDIKTVEDVKKIVKDQDTSADSIKMDSADTKKRTDLKTGHVTEMKAFDSASLLRGANGKDKNPPNTSMNYKVGMSVVPNTTFLKQEDIDAKRGTVTKIEGNFIYYKNSKDEEMKVGPGDLIILK